MTWPSIYDSLVAALPDHCTPQSEFLFRFSALVHTCIPTPLAFLSNLLGLLSIVSWLFGQLPQVYKNWSLGSTSGLSISFLVVWCLGDLSNLLGALFTHQATWQVAIGSYYVFVDLCLVSQWLWYEKLRHGHPVLRVWRSFGRSPRNDGRSAGPVVIEGMEPAADSDGHDDNSKHVSDSLIKDDDAAKSRTTGQTIVFRSPTFADDCARKEEEEKASLSFSTTPRSNTLVQVGSSSPLPSPSPRTVLFIACLIAIVQVQASPLSTPSADPRDASESIMSPLEWAGTILSWMSTALYLGSRFPQLIKNWKRKSTEGLSPLLFAAAFCGNLFYSAALLTNPCAWSNLGPYGGHGWVGREGSDRLQWVTAALPFFLGAFGVLGLDASVGVQFLMYDHGPKKLVVVAEHPTGRWRWRSVSGYMRGWVPSISHGRSDERRALLGHEQVHSAGYGGA